MIVGAGLADLALAQTLRKQNVPFTIFEREVSANGRTQGWGIALSWTVEPLYRLSPQRKRINLPSRPARLTLLSASNKLSIARELLHGRLHRGDSNQRREEA